MSLREAGACRRPKMSTRPRSTVSRSSGLRWRLGGRRRRAGQHRRASATTSARPPGHPRRLRGQHRLAGRVPLERRRAARRDGTGPPHLPVPAPPGASGCGAGWIETEPAGYRLTTPDDALEHRRFAALRAAATEAREHDDPQTALRHLDEALASWSGDPFRELEDLDWALAEIEQLRLDRLEMLEERWRSRAPSVGTRRSPVNSRRSRPSTVCVIAPHASSRWRCIAADAPPRPLRVIDDHRRRLATVRRHERNTRPADNRTRPLRITVRRPGGAGCMTRRRHRGAGRFCPRPLTAEGLRNGGLRRIWHTNRSTTASNEPCDVGARWRTAPGRPAAGPSSR